MGRTRSRPLTHVPFQSPAGIVSWTREEMEAADVKTRKLLTIHPKSNVQRLYPSRKEGGRGLVSVQATVLDEPQDIQEYIRKMAPKDELLGERLRQQQRGTDDRPEETPWHSKDLHWAYHRHQEILPVAGKSRTCAGTSAPSMDQTLPSPGGRLL